MGYKIHYGRSGRKQAARRRLRGLLLTVTFFSLFLLFAIHFFPEQMRMIRNTLLSYERVDSLVSRIRQGHSLVDAVTAFCEEIIHGQ